jgi:exopolysaccharide biosynthesis polyprenyl glycosylphosphotransferase
MMPLRFLFFFWVYCASVLSVSRFGAHFLAGYLRLHGRNLRYLLIIGTNPRAVEFAHRVLSNKELGYRLIGFVDDEWSGSSGFEASGFFIVSSYADLADYLRHTVVDEVAMYLPLSDFFRTFSEVATLCEQHGILMRFNADVFSLNIARWRTELFDGDHYIATYTGSTHGWPQMVKRLIDILVSATLLLFLLPILISVAIAIKISSPGSVLFLQERIGLNKRRFNIYKFRTMVPNAERLIETLREHNETDGPTFKMKSDPRITPIGRFLRKSSLDELPQLFNVLKGDMSLVGPRPLPVRDYQGFNGDWQRRRFSIKPGITCLWQINGRSGITFNQWMLLDLKYLDEWSLWLDMKILAKTLPAVLKGAGAA